MNDPVVQGSSGELHWVQIRSGVASAAKRKLVVWAPAFVGGEATELAIGELFQGRLADSDRVLFRYRGGLSNTNAFELAAELQHVISGFWSLQSDTGDPYDEVVLVGYSTGALLLRKAIVFGSGQLEDHPFPERGQLSVPVWSSILDRARVVLLAGTNRGWSFAERPQHMPTMRYLAHRILSGILRPIPLGQFIYSLERGQPFVANLRVQWLRMTHRRGARMPPVIQLLGSRDDIVAKEDNKDVLVSENFIFLPVQNSGHASIVQIHDPVDGRARYDALADAVAADIGALKDRYGSHTTKLRLDELGAEAGESRSASDGAPVLVFLMHGIRANSDWPRRLQEVIKAEAATRFVRCVTSSYGHFPMSAFLLLNMRRKNVRWFMDRYTEELAKILPFADSPDDVEINFVGHSNGTYLLAEGLRTYASMRFNRVAFMGSVVPSTFPWRSYFGGGRVTALRNDRSARDWIVGCFPGFYQLIGTLLPIPFFTELGNGGLRGFDQMAGYQHIEKFYFPGGHSEPTKEYNHASLARFILGKPDASAASPLGEESQWCVYASRLCWLVWLALAAVILAGGYALYLVAPVGWGLRFVLLYAALLLTLSTTI